ncbi:PTS sugar transporter subunit IIA [candidate division WOR-3 bacterium]|nr:PTS sugar transporter subunit IIA [candidate division WOR-3 bacterium]
MKFKDVLNKNFVILDLEVETREELFRYFSGFLYSKNILKDKNKFIEELTSRENKGSTAIGKGIALPHARLHDLKKSYIVIARLKQGIPFNGIEDQLVKLAVLIISPEKKPEEYLKILSGIASVLHREETFKKLMKAKDPASVISIISSRPKENFFTKNMRLFYFFGAVAAIFILFVVMLPLVKIPFNDEALARGDLKFNESIWVTKQIWASSIFFSTVIGTLLFWQYRVAIAAFGLSFLLLSGTMDLKMTVEFMSIPTILFIISMMIVVAWLDYIGVFKFLVSFIIKKVGFYPRKIFFILMFLSVILGGLTGEVTGILVVASIALSLTSEMNLPAFPFIISLIFGTNIGSALTLIGNPIGIYIAFLGNLSFEDFLRWASPLSIITTVVLSLFLLFLFRKSIPAKIKAFQTDTNSNENKSINPWESVENIKKMKIGGFLFILLVILIGFSKRVDAILNLFPNTSLVAMPLAFAGVIVFMEGRRGKNLITEGVDWWTILFFMFLFAKAACLEYTGVTTKLAYQIANFSQNIQIGGMLNPEHTVTATALVIITTSTALASGFVDNLPIIAALVPVVKGLKIIGLSHTGILWWGLLFGGCLGGNLTMIGSSANMVALSVYEKSEGKIISFSSWLKFGLPVVLISIILVLFLMILQIGMSP